MAFTKVDNKARTGFVNRLGGVSERILGSDEFIKLVTQKAKFF